MGILDLNVQDALYQKRGVTSPDIVLIGIDEKSFELLGPYSEWNRDIVANVVSYLNASDEVHPAVICLDVVYAGHRDELIDSYLVDACAKYDNVVAASMATFGTDIVDGADGSLYLDNNVVQSYEGPFDELSKVVTTGAINTSIDRDGVLRHHRLKLDLGDGTVVDSMALAAAKKHKNIENDANMQLPTVDKNYSWYVPFSGYPEDYSDSISVADILLEEIPADYFDDKIVFIGPYAIGMQDNYITAIDHTIPMYGVEYQANALQALLEGNYKKEVNDILQYAILFAILAFSLYIFLNKKMKIATILWLAEIIAYPLVCLLLYLNGLILHVIYIPLMLTVGYVGCVGVNYVRSVVEKRAVTNTFKRYVAPEVVNEILKSGADNLGFGGKVVNIAVLFVDVRGFTTMSEALPPEQVVKILNDYLTLIADCILKNGGTLDKFVGDAAMAFWGAPLECEDYVMKAVQAAADMVAGSEKLSEVLLEKYGRSVSFGVGVHVGDAVVGNMGSPMRMDFTAIGDTVNTAARLEANAPGGKVYISRKVMDALDGRIKAKSLGDSIKLKGKADGFEVLELEEIL